MSEDSYAFTTYSGLLTPDHYQRIGAAIWLFLWCISSTTKEVEKDGVTWGIVKGNKPHKLSELAEIFGVNEKTVRRWMDALESHEYIRITRAPYGLILTVRNSKKFKNRVDKNVQSEHERERTKMSNHPADMSNLSDKNVQSNKDITEDITKDITNVVVNIRARQKQTENEMDPVDHIADYFMMRYGKPGYAPRASDYNEIKSVMSSGVPLNDILQGIDQAFDEFKPKYDGDKITSFAYCKKVILSNFYDNKAKEEAKKVEYKPKSPSRRNPRVAPVPEFMREDKKQQDQTAALSPDEEEWLDNYLKNL